MQLNWIGTNTGAARGGPQLNGTRCFFQWREYEFTHNLENTAWAPECVFSTEMVTLPLPALPWS